MIFSPGDRVLMILGEDVEAGEVITVTSSRDGTGEIEVSYTIMTDEGQTFVEIDDWDVHPEIGIGPRPEPPRPRDYPPCE